MPNIYNNRIQRYKETSSVINIFLVRCNMEVFFFYFKNHLLTLDRERYKQHDTGLI